MCLVCRIPPYPHPLAMLSRRPSLPLPKTVPPSSPVWLLSFSALVSPLWSPVESRFASSPLCTGTLFVRTFWFLYALIPLWVFVRSVLWTPHFRTLVNSCLVAAPYCQMNKPAVKCRPSSQSFPPGLLYPTQSRSDPPPITNLPSHPGSGGQSLIQLPTGLERNHSASNRQHNTRPLSGVGVDA